jgi:excisionase family DNA binding protein
MTRRYITVDAAAEMLSVSPRTIRRMISRGELAGYRLGPRLLRVDEAEVQALLRRIPTVGHFENVRRIR